MRRTEFWERMHSRFGERYAASIASDHVFSALGSRTVDQALAAGEEPRDVWLAVCDAYEVPARDR